MKYLKGMNNLRSNRVTFKKGIFNLINHLRMKNNKIILK